MKTPQLKRLRLPGINRIISAHIFVWIAAILLIIICVSRFLQAPSFWLDEAWIAVGLRDPTLQTIFSRLQKGLVFPRLYLTCLAGLRELLGYKIWVLRIVPSFFFIVATVLWARLLIKRSGSSLAANLLGGGLLVGSFFWLGQAIQLKQYSFDVLVALIPFVLDDDFYERALSRDGNKTGLALLSLPCLLSYTYPMALLARCFGWYLQHLRHRGWRLNWQWLLLAGFTALGFTSMYLTDYQFNFKDHTSYFSYWDKCILGSQMRVGIGSGLRLIADFLWGWHAGRLKPLVLVAIVPLQALGTYHILSRWKNSSIADDFRWGSRSLGSLVLLAGAILASVVVNYPICAGRLVLFAQVHLQILAVEGVLLIVSLWGSRKLASAFLCACIGIVGLYSAHRYIRFAQVEPRENLRLLLPMIMPELANTIWVEPCAEGQVRSLPDSLPVANVILKTRDQDPPPGERVWIVWAGLSDDYCRKRLDEIRSKATSWQTIHEGPGRGLALAQF